MPVTITATLPYERNPDVLRVQDANLSAPLPPAGRPLTLYAENTTFKKATGANVLLTVAAERTGRIFTFAGFLPPLGETVRLAPITYPMVRVRASVRARADALGRQPSSFAASRMRVRVWPATPGRSAASSARYGPRPG